MRLWKRKHTDHPNPLQRIREKLAQAARQDNLLQIFGASRHKYILHEPLSPAAVEAFEQKHGIALPQELTDFLTAVGSGGAGPYHGLYTLEQMEQESARLAEPCILRPDFTEEEWWELEALYEKQAEEANEGCEAGGERMFQGTLCIGTQGWTHDTVLILNGPYRGRIVYIDRDEQRPFFAYEKNFLNWYERWLDELIAGRSVERFGRLPGGSEQELLALFDETDDDQLRLEALRGLFKIPALGPGTTARLRHIFRETEPYTPLALVTLQHLAKADYPYVENDLLDVLHNSPRSEERQVAARLLQTYMPTGTLRKKVPDLTKLLHQENDHGVVHSLLMLIQAAGAIDSDALLERRSPIKPD